jgi:hypothetical protein
MPAIVIDAVAAARGYLAPRRGIGPPDQNTFRKPAGLSL